MTHPGGVELDDRPDPKVTYLLDGLPLGEFDADDCWWIVRKTEGWHDPVGVRDAAVDMPDGPGVYDGETFAEARFITISATVLAPDARARNAARDRFTSLCSDPQRRYELRVTDQARDVRTAMVRRTGKSRFEVRNERLADAQLLLRAGDPRKHAGTWQQPFATAPVAGILGLDFAGTGLDFSGGGLDFGTPERPNIAEVINLGTAPARPLFTLTGPLTQPMIVHRETDRAVRMYGDVAEGETVTVNCDAFPAGGFTRHARWSSTRGDVGALIPMVTEWPQVDPYTRATYELRGGGSTSGGLRVALRHAWW